MNAADLTYEAIACGDRAARRYAITPDVYAHFLGAFADHNPIHVDEDYARSHGFRGRVMHGAILNGFVSHFVGMHFVGRRALLLSVDLRYANPSHLDDVLEVRGTVTQKVDALRVVVLKLEIENLTRSELAARGRAQIKVDAL